MQFNNGESASRMDDIHRSTDETGSSNAVTARHFNHQQPLLEKRNRKAISLKGPDIKSISLVQKQYPVICCLYLTLKTKFIERY